MKRRRFLRNLVGHSRAEIRDAIQRRHGSNAGHFGHPQAGGKGAEENQRAIYTGRRMHLVQFVGPVQPAWHEELLAAGVRIVTYLPQNSYSGLRRRQQHRATPGNWAANAPHIQWEAPYLDNYKIHPAARAVGEKGNPRQIGTDEFEVQLVDDAAANAGTLQLLNNSSWGRSGSNTRWRVT